MKDYSEKAKIFYHSDNWKRTRKAYKSYRFGICERCGKPNSSIVHHKNHLNSARLDDVNYTLNWDNLELLCIDCHNREHFLLTSATQEGLYFDENGNLIKRN